MTDHPSTRLRPKADVVCRQLGDAAVLIDLQTNGIFELNRTGYRVWELLLDGLSADEIAARVNSEFDVDAAQAASDVHALLTRLRDERLVVEELTTE